MLMKNDIFSEHLSIHDKYRFEIKINLKQNFSKEHLFEYYFFIPSSLNVSYLTYSKEQFYSAIQRYIRYSAPSITVAELFNLSSKISPYSRTVKVLEELKTNNSQYLIETAIDELKLIAVILKDRITESILKSDLNKAISELLFIKSAVFESFGSIYKKIASFDCPVSIKRTFIVIDEYVTLLLLESIAKVLENNSNSITPILRSSLCSAAEELSRYRKSQGYIYAEGDERDYFLYYRGLLKKFVSSCLFLESEPAFNIYSHIAASIGSAIAMLFAVIIMVYAQMKYSITSAVFIVIAVVSYVFKDRIKDFVKILFFKKAGKYIYDRKIKITEPSHKLSIGYIKESFFISNVSSIDSDIRREREKSYSLIPEDMAAETVLKYKKIIKIDPEKILSYHIRRHDLVDIMRFSIYDFLKHADDENINYPVYVDGLFREKKISKNYILNIVVKYVNIDEIVYERYRIVFNRSGIINVDRV